MDVKTGFIFLPHPRETHLNFKGKHLPLGKDLNKIFQVNEARKQAGVAILMCSKINFKTRLTREDREGCYVFIKGELRQGNIAILNICAPNTGHPCS